MGRYEFSFTYFIFFTFTSNLFCQIDVVTAYVSPFCLRFRLLIHQHRGVYRRLQYGITVVTVMLIIVMVAVVILMRVIVVVVVVVDVF